MFLVAGLGNPGEEYALSPHNLGFLTVDRLAERHGIRVTRKDSKSLVGVGEIEGRAVMLAKPQTFMNVSGPSVKGLLARYELQPGQLLLVYDELDLPWRSLRIRPNGSAGGHHGVDSVIGSIGSVDFPRVRLGIHGGSRDRGYLAVPLQRVHRCSQRVSSGPRNHRGSEKLRDSQTLSDPASVQRSLRPQLFLIVRGARRRTRKLDDLRWLDRPRARGDWGDNHEG